MPEHPDIIKLLTEAVQAPSGDNSQPWYFREEGDVLLVYALPERDHPILNIEDRGTLIATGALLENLSLLSARDGLAANIDLRLEPAAQGVLIARVSFSKVASNSSAEASAISSRHTNRNPYKVIPLNLETMQELQASARAPVTLSILTDREGLTKVGKAGSLMEKIALTTKELHRLFFGDLLWSQEESDAGTPGLYVRTLELPPPIIGLFKLLRNWSFASLMNRLGFANVAAAGNASLYAKSSGMALFHLPAPSAQDMIEVGRAIQRFWLKATAKSLAVQPVAGLIYLAEYARRNPAGILSESQQVEIREAGELIREVFKVPRENVPVMLLRFGIPEKPASARSRRKKPDLRP